MFGTIVIAVEGLLAAKCLKSWASVYHRFPKPGQSGSQALAAEYYILVGGSILAVVASAATIDIVATRLGGFSSLHPRDAVASLVALSFQAGFTGLLTFSGPDPQQALGYLWHDLGILQSIAYVWVLLSILLGLDQPASVPESPPSGEEPPRDSRRTDGGAPTQVVGRARAQRRRRWVAAAIIGGYAAAQLIVHHGPVIRP